MSIARVVQPPARHTLPLKRVVRIAVKSAEIPAVLQVVCSATACRYSAEALGNYEPPLTPAPLFRASAYDDQRPRMSRHRSGPADE